MISTSIIRAEPPADFRRKSRLRSSYPRKENSRRHVLLLAVFWNPLLKYVPYTNPLYEIGKMTNKFISYIDLTRCSATSHFLE